MTHRYISWAAANAQRVFERRQQTRWSFRRLAEEFKTSPPTVRAAIAHYLETHPRVRDEVHLSAGGQRPRRIHVEQLAQEARELWEAGAAKAALATKFGCSTPMVDRMLEVAYQRDGMPLLRNFELRAARVAKARAMFDEGHPIEEIASELRMTAGTIATYIQESLIAEGKKMTRLQKRNARNQASRTDGYSSES